MVYTVFKKKGVESGWSVTDISLEKDLPVIVWDFHSLPVMVQMCFSFMLTDKDSEMCARTSLMSINQEKIKKGHKSNGRKQECKYHNRCGR